MIALLIAHNALDAKDDRFDYYYNDTDEAASATSIGFDTNVTKPSDSLGYGIGEWHIRPDQSFAYFNQLAKSSAKVQVELTGYSHEQRPLIAAYISSPENIAQLEEFKQQRGKLDDYQGPNIVYLGYSVHGNEASGANAAPLVAYRLAASQEPWIKALLENTIVIIDPMLNPDGLDRFANWVNRYKGTNLVSDPESIEHNEAWPVGRTNHYWFDLNRDWLLLQNPESRARVNLFYQWRPHIVGDFHEMGTNATYFFQPGVQSRQNPLTPKKNFDLTNQIATYHAKALDKLGVPYFSKERFDDFFYGKGSTFPDINGGIGILFEQASSRGHIKESINGDVSFPFAIRNQVATSFSTLKAANELDETLSKYQKDFFKQQQDMSRSDSVKGIVISSSDSGRLKEFISLLEQHQIKVEAIQSDLSFNREKFSKESSYLISLGQKQYGLIKSLFEKRKTFEDNTFYDVSAWTFPLAFNIDYKELNQSEFQSVSVEDSSDNDVSKKTTGQWFSLDNNANYHSVIVEQNDERMVKNLYSILAIKADKDFSVKYSTKEFTLGKDEKIKTFEAGSVILSFKGLANKGDKKSFEEAINKVFIDNGIDVYSTGSGFAKSGVDLGSPSVKHVEIPKPLLLIGDGVSPYEAGEVWHLLDTRLQIPLSMQSAQDLGRIDLTRYSHLIMVNGRYPKLEDDDKKELRRWVQQGGNIVASRGAVSWLSKQGLTSIKVAKAEKVKKLDRDFAQRDDARAEHFIGGAIYQTLLDNSHPLTYGIDSEDLAFTKTGAQVLEPVDEDFISVANYSHSPLLAGYSSSKNLERIKDTPAVIAQSFGSGSIIMFNDNPNFRGYWYGSARLFINALFFNNAL